MDPTDLSDAQLDQLAQRLAPHLPSGTHGDRVVLSRRAFAAAVGGTLGASGLVALGVDPAAAQAAGQVGTSADPMDTFAYNLDVQNGATFNGTDIEGVGSLSTESLDVTQAPFFEPFDITSGTKTLWGSWDSSLGGTSIEVSHFSLADGDPTEIFEAFAGAALVFVQGGAGANTRFGDLVLCGRFGVSVISKNGELSAPSRTYTQGNSRLVVELGSAADISVFCFIGTVLG